MRMEDLSNILGRRPFAPVRLHMTDGTVYDIRHPEAAILTRSYVAVGVTPVGGTLGFDQLMFLNLIQIVRVEDLAAHPASAF